MSEQKRTPVNFLNSPDQNCSLSCIFISSIFFLRLFMHNLLFFSTTCGSISLTSRRSKMCLKRRTNYHPKKAHIFFFFWIVIEMRKTKKTKKDKKEVSEIQKVSADEKSNLKNFTFLVKGISLVMIFLTINKRRSS